MNTRTTRAAASRRAARIGQAAGLLALALGTFVPTVEAQGPTSPGAPDGRQIYQSTCAACHGRDGRGAPQSVVAFATPLPDFTSCTFATREPDADWGSIVRHGGPARAFDRMMPAFGEALTAEEIQAAVDHVRTFCSERGWPRGELNLPRPLVTEKAFPEDELVLSTAIDTEGTGSVTTKLVYERRFGARNQIELVLPVAAHERESGGWRGGIGDVAVGLKRALAHSVRTGSILSATGEIVLPTGDAGDGFGKGVGVFEPFVTFGQILPADSFVQVQAGIELPFDTDRAAREAFWRVAVGKSVSQRGYARTWSPMLELLAARELVEGEDTQWDLVPQLQVTLSTRQHLMLNVGVRVPLSDAGPRRTQLLMYVLWDWFDGGLFDGW